jgi:DNA polymerase elongation subunit (family B)
VDTLDDAEATNAEKGRDALSHLIGSKDEDVRFLPTLHTGIEKDARRQFSEREKYALIEEDGEASNAHKVDVKGTHYESQDASEIALTMLPLMGL